MCTADRTILYFFVGVKEFFVLIDSKPICHGSNIVADNLTLRVGAGLLTSFNVGGLIFTVTDGSTDFVAADLFDVAVAANGKFVPLDPAALDGSGEFAGIYNGDDITEAAIITKLRQSGLHY